VERGSSFSLLFEEADFQDEVVQARTLAQLRGWFRTFCLRVSGHLRTWRDTQGYSTAARIRDVIDRDYAKELRIKKIAEDLFFSPDYLGRLFKAAYGVGFNEYLNGRRIEAAKKLLLGTSQSVASISGIVGFQTADYFTRLFKRYEGVTPNGFRYMKKQEDKA
jgi:two-component system response regulator YesN